MTTPVGSAVNNPYIERDPWKPGRANAVIAVTGVAVWAIIAYWQGVGDRDTVGSDYELTPAQLQAAFDYYEQNRAAIDARIEENEAG